MDFIEGLIDRIRLHIGLEFESDENFSYFQPAGNEHMTQFFYKNFAEEYWELESWDRHNLFLCELSSQLDCDFSLDDDGNFATLNYTSGKKAKAAAVVMDLRDDYIVIVYFFGDARVCFKVNQMLKENNGLHPCNLGLPIFEQMSCELELINRLEYEFEQHPALFLNPVQLKGVVEGDVAHLIYHQFLQNYRTALNIRSFSGRISDESQGSLTFSCDGLIQVEDCRLSDFMKMVKHMFLLVRTKYKSLADKCILNWNNDNEKVYTELEGNIIEFWLNKPVEKLDGLLKYLTKGDRQLRFFGSAERVSRKLWSVKTIDLDSKRQLEVEASEDLIRVYLKEKSAIPLLDFIEGYIRSHIAADIENNIY